MIHRCVEIFPPAKLNLFLEVLGKRPDGYHELDSVMMAVDLRDRLRVTTRADAEITLNCRWLPNSYLRGQRFNDHCTRTDSTANILALPAVKDNLVTRAIRLFTDRFSISHGFHIQLDKQIPAGAGMGGASSNAASALLAAARLCGIEGDCADLVDLARQLGSDVPFFLGRGSETISRISPSSAQSSSVATGFSIARAQGRGEVLTGVPNRGSWNFVLCYPPEALSTALVYKHCVCPDRPVDANDCLSALSDGSITSLSKSLFNRLMAPARSLSNWIDKTIESMQNAGLANATMTGSGSACFAPTTSYVRARRIANRLSSRQQGICFAVRCATLPAPIRFLT